MKTLFNTLLFVVFLYTGMIYSQQNQLQLEKSTNSPLMDGVINEKEWNGAKKITLERDSDWNIDVLVSYDDHYLYVAFAHLTGTDQTRLNAEVLIQTDMDTSLWDEQAYWFHSSYGNCYAIGEYYIWEHCSMNQTTWKANTYPFKNGNNNIEFKISFAALQMEAPKAGTKLKVAFKLSGADEIHTYWPINASIESPNSWGVLLFE